MSKSQTVHALKGGQAKNGESKWQELRAELSHGKVTWADAGAEDLLAALVAVTEDGAALLLSRTSDGGALAIHVLEAGLTHKLYPASVAELNEALQIITDIARAR